MLNHIMLRSSATSNIKLDQPGEFSDDFNRVDLFENNQWTQLKDPSYTGSANPEWKIVSNQLMPSINSYSNFVTIFLIANFTIKPLSFFASYTETSFSTEASQLAAGLLFNWTDVNNYYVFANVAATSTWNITKRVDGVSTTIATVESPNPVPGYTIRVERDDDILKCYNDDLLIFEYTDSDISLGTGVGIVSRTRGTTPVTRIDNFSAATNLTIPGGPETGTPIEGRPHPYYTPKTYTLDGVAGIPDPYQPYPNEKIPVNADGVIEGVLASPSLYGYPDETNTGVPLNYPLTTINGEIIVETSKVRLIYQGVETVITRPGSGQPPITVGPITLYANDDTQPVNDLSVPNRPIPLNVNTIIDGAWTNNKITTNQAYNILVINSVLNGRGRSTGAIDNNYKGGDRESGISDKANYVICLDSRIYGNGAEATFIGIRIITRRCNISGGADLLQPRTGNYHEFVYGHGVRSWNGRHNDAIQNVGSYCDEIIAAYFGGWGSSVRCATLLPYGEKNGAQFIMMGNQLTDMDRVLYQDIVGAGAVSVIRGGLGWVCEGYDYKVGKWFENPAYQDANGKPDASLVPVDPSWTIKRSSITQQDEWHPNTQLVFFDNIRFNEKKKNTAPAVSIGFADQSPIATEGIVTRDWYRISNRDLYGTGYPYTSRNLIWDNDGLPGRNFTGPAGYLDWADIDHPKANSLDFSRLYPVTKPLTDQA